MGAYAHRFIEVLDKDNKWKQLPLWSKYKENSYSQPDVVGIPGQMGRILACGA